MSKAPAPPPKTPQPTWSSLGAFSHLSQMPPPATSAMGPTPLQSPSRPGIWPMPKAIWSPATPHHQIPTGPSSSRPWLWWPPVPRDPSRSWHGPTRAQRRSGLRSGSVAAGGKAEGGLLSQPRARTLTVSLGRFWALLGFISRVANLEVPSCQARMGLLRPLPLPLQPTRPEPGHWHRRSRARPASRSDPCSRSRSRRDPRRRPGLPEPVPHLQSADRTPPAPGASEDSLPHAGHCGCAATPTPGEGPAQNSGVGPFPAGPSLPP